jgi:hypothetical protein
VSNVVPIRPPFIKLHSFMTTPALAGPEFSNESWAVWRCVARLIDGDAHLLTETERELVLKLTGRSTLPTAVPDQMAVGAGRRSGKSRFCALMAVWYASQDYRSRMSPGESAVVALCAPDRKQAGLLLDYVSAILHASKLLEPEIYSESANSIELRHSSKIEVVTSNFRTLRGRTICAAILDEVSFLRSEDSAVPDVELYRALTPAMLTLHGTLVAISSPHMKRGLMYQLYGKYFANDNATRLYLQSDSLTLNPTLNIEAIEAAMAEDPEAGRSELLGEFRNDLSAFLPAEDLDAAIIPGRRTLQPSQQYMYRAFCDPSGGRSDSMTLGISHMEGSKLILDKLVAVAPPFDPEAVVVRFCEVLASFGLNRVVGDQYAGDWVASSFARHGVAYQPSELSASQIYIECGVLFSQGLVELLDITALRTELSLLERRPRAGNRGDSVSHPRGFHDDQAISALGSLLLVATHMDVGRDESPNSISHALRDPDPYAEPIAVRPSPRRLPPGFGGRAIESNYSRALRDHDIFLINQGD